MSAHDRSDPPILLPALKPTPPCKHPLTTAPPIYERNCIVCGAQLFGLERAMLSVQDMEAKPAPSSLVDSPE